MSRMDLVRNLMRTAQAGLCFLALIAPRAALAQASEDPFPSTGPISGYMELHLNRPEDVDPILDFHRFVLLVNHSFSSRIRFIGELELEHALVEGLEEAG